MGLADREEALKHRNLHPWRLPYAEAVAVQEQLREQLVVNKRPAVIRRVAGADVAYSRASQRLYAAVLVFSYPDLELLESRSSRRKAAYPYLPGLLSFREAPVLLQTFEKLARRPDLVIFDGQGIAHPRGMGLAAHMGILLDLPTLGCAKGRLVGTHCPVGESKGSVSLLRRDTTVIGAAVRTRERVKPVYVSPGHRMDVAGAVQMTLALCRGYRLPDPTRRAHLAVKRLRRAGP